MNQILIYLLKCYILLIKRVQSLLQTETRLYNIAIDAVSHDGSNNQLQIFNAV